MYWNKPYECMPREQLEQLQSKRLVKLVERLYHNVPFYRTKLQERGLDPHHIKGLEDLNRLPFTRKTDLRDNYPYGLFAEPINNIVRIHASSGTTGKPTVVGYTRNDLNNWSEIAARCLMAASATKNSMIQNAYGYGLFTGGLGIHGGAEKLGASIIPVSSGNTEKQLMLMKDFHTTHITCTPSYALYLAESLKTYGIAISDLQLKAGIFGAEPWSEKMREEIEKRLHIKAYDIYGLSEICGPGVGIECVEQKGMHIWEDQFLMEIIDPVTEESLPLNTMGELVITTLTKEGIPLLRYRTGDRTMIMDELCPCGRTHRKIQRLVGRTDDMIIVRGVNVFPTQIESVLISTGHVTANYQLIVKREGILDKLEVRVELNEDQAIDSLEDLNAIERKILQKIHGVLGIQVKLTLLEPGTLQRSEGKAQRLIDLRNI
ncbi:MAG: phenylacetate--CoA ligase [Eubacteriaceae bacterium]|nr:phenylacetate--CoA ligase [Eubacteriaceae bacterium]